MYIMRILLRTSSEDNLNPIKNSHNGYKNKRFFVTYLVNKWFLIAHN